MHLWSQYYKDYKLNIKSHSQTVSHVLANPLTKWLVKSFWDISRAVINLPAVLRCLLSVDLLRVGMASVDSFCDLVIIDGAVIIVLEELGDLSPLSKLQIQHIYSNYCLLSTGGVWIFDCRVEYTVMGLETKVPDFFRKNFFAHNILAR